MSAPRPYPGNDQTPGAGTAELELLAKTAELAKRLGCRGGEPPVVLSNRGGWSEEVVVRVSELVVKIHSRGTDPSRLAARLQVALDPLLKDVLLQPVAIPRERVGPPGTPQPGDQGARTTIMGDRLATAWPCGTPVDPADPEGAPWETAAALLAGLHAVPAPSGAPPMGGPARVARAIARLRASGSRHPGARSVLSAYHALPPWAAGLPGGDHGAGGEPRASAALVHGDWHLGQLVAVAGRWLLIDLDTLGFGDPAWDLARPAAWFAAGALSSELWERFLQAYRAAGGRAVPEGDPWAALDVPARALVVQAAATALAKAAAAPATGDPPGTAGRQLGYQMDELDRAVIACCERIARG